MGTKQSLNEDIKANHTLERESKANPDGERNKTHRQEHTRSLRICHSSRMSNTSKGFAAKEGKLSQNDPLRVYLAKSDFIKSGESVTHFHQTRYHDSSILVDVNRLTVRWPTPKKTHRAPAH